MLSNMTGLRLHPLAPENEDSEDENEENDDKEEDLDIKAGPSTSSGSNGSSSGSSSGPNGLSSGSNGTASGSNGTNSKSNGTVSASNEAGSKSNGTGSKSNGTNDKPEDEIDPKCKIEVRKWNRGCYTLLSDSDINNDKYVLDGRLFFNCEDWNIEQGGFTSYIAKDEDEELLTAMPENNTLHLIYKDAQTLGFVKYVNDEINALSNGEFHDIAVAYFE